MRPSTVCYDVFGLVAESSIDLPLPHAAQGKQIEIRAGTVCPQGETLYESAEPVAFGCYRRDDNVLLVWEDARFSVTRDRVVVDADHIETATQLLVPAVWSVVLAAHQRESLHGSAVAWQGRGVAILGHSGSGKSTAARSMIQRGWKLVSDDLLAFDADLRVVPGPPWIRLLPDDDHGGRSVFDPAGKARIHATTSGTSVPLCAMIIMDPRYEGCAKLAGTSAVSALLQQIYNPVVTHEGQARRRFELIHALAVSTPIYAVPPRSLSPDQIEEIAKGE